MAAMTWQGTSGNGRVIGMVKRKTERFCAAARGALEVFIAVAPGLKLLVFTLLPFVTLQFINLYEV